MQGPLPRLEPLKPGQEPKSWNTDGLSVTAGDDAEAVAASYRMRPYPSVPRRAGRMFTLDGVLTIALLAVILGTLWALTR